MGILHPSQCFGQHILNPGQGKQPQGERFINVVAREHTGQSKVKRCFYGIFLVYYRCPGIRHPGIGIRFLVSPDTQKDKTVGKGAKLDLKGVAVSLFFGLTIGFVSHAAIDPAIIFERWDVLLICIVTATAGSIVSAQFANRVSVKVVGLVTGAILTKQRLVAAGMRILFYQGRYCFLYVPENGVCVL